MRVSDVRCLVLASSAPRDAISYLLGAQTTHDLSIGGQPLVSFAISAARRAGIEEIGVVVSTETRASVEAALSQIKSDDITWLETPQPRGFVDSVFKARDFLEGSPFLVHHGDAIVLHSLDPFVDRVRSGETDALLLGQGARQARGEYLASVKPHVPRRFDRTLAGAHLFSNRALELGGAVWETCPDGGPHEFGGEISRSGGTIETRAVDGSWRYRGSVDDVIEANRMVLDRLDADADAAAAQHPDARIEGRALVDPTATLDGTTVRGPAVIGPGAVVRDSFVGPYTTIGRNAVLEGTEIEHSIVLAEATLRHPGRRLSASLIGEGAVITRNFGLPAAMCVRVGSRTEVRLV